MARSDDSRRVSVLQLGELPRRPPGSLPEDKFVTLCDSCAQCVDVCPNSGILMDRDGLPVVVVDADSCGRCHLCSDICTRGALDAPWGQGGVPAVKADRDTINTLVEAVLPAVLARFGGGK